MRLASTPELEVTSPSSAARDFFYPPEELERATQETLEQLKKHLPLQPSCWYPSSVNGPSQYDRSQAITLMNAVTQWTEHLSTQIGARRAHMQSLQAGVSWMTGVLKYRHKGKLEQLTHEQFERLQRDQYSAACLEAEITLLESKVAALAKPFQNASRNLTGIIAPSM